MMVLVHENHDELPNVTPIQHFCSSYVICIGAKIFRCTYPVFLMIFTLLSPLNVNTSHFILIFNIWSRSAQYCSSWEEHVNGRRTSHDDGRQSIALDHLSDSGNLKTFLIECLYVYLVARQGRKKWRLVMALLPIIYRFRVLDLVFKRWPDSSVVWHFNLRKHET